MDIQIQNPEAVVRICDTISKKNQKLYDTCSQLQSYLTKINSKIGVDNQSFVMKLEKQISNINFLNNSIKNITSSLLSYIDKTKESLPLNTITKSDFNINNSKEDIFTLLKEIDECYTELGTHIKGASINSLIDSIELNISAIINSMSEPFDELLDSLDTKVTQEFNEYQSALSILTEAFAFIETYL